MATPKVSKSKRLRISRRQVLLGGAIGLPLLGLGMNRVNDNGGPHNEYFLKLQQALKDADLYKPTLVIDRAKLRANCGRLRLHLPPGMNYRIVAKSLPCDGLINEVMTETGSRSLMVFHQPFLNHVDEKYSDSDLLLGKPLPVAAADKFFRKRLRVNAAKNVQWLIDSNARLAEYEQLPERYGPLRINLEIDVGLHRGGFADQEELAKALKTIEASPRLIFSGFMGYEPQIVKMPGIMGGPKKALANAKARYQECIDTAKSVLGDSFNAETLTLNTAGSPTFQLYDETAPVNELAMGSGLVKPSDFDIDTLADHEAAVFVATPVLKKMQGTTLPGLEAAKGLMSFLDTRKAQSFFTYGGYWKASPVSPPGLEGNAIFGHSTNQELVNGSDKVELEVNDFVFLRPHQSEHVFLQFGDIAVYDDGRIVDYWPVFQERA